MDKNLEDSNALLTNVAVFLALFAILLWALPNYLGGTVDQSLPQVQPFTGLTDFGDPWIRGRMPAFIVAAFSSIFLLQLRRR